jgi:GABA(A) receptor-associated protein
MPSAFQECQPFEKRAAESARIRAKYGERIPVIVERSVTSDLEPIDKTKFLVPGDLTVGQFIYVVRRRIKLEAETALFLTVNGTMMATSATMSHVDAAHCHEDGFLYVTYSGENTFG